MCLHCETKGNCTSLNCVLRSTKKPISTCNRGSNSLKISKVIYDEQTDEVKNAVRKLSKEDNKARRGYRLFTVHDNSIRGEPLAASINNDKAIAREQREAKKRATVLPETKLKYDIILQSYPALKSLPAKDFTELHFKQIELYDKIEKDLNRLKITREERAKESAMRRDMEAEKDKLRGKLKEKVETKLSVPLKSNELKADKRAERKERAMAKKQSELKAKAEIKVNQAKLQSMAH